MQSLRSRGLPLASAGVQVETLRGLSTLPTFEATLAQRGLAPLRRGKPSVLQLNVGKLCNQTCAHCHVDAGPDRREVMTRETMEDCLRALAATDIPAVDLTGGAPELNPNFRWLVEQVRAVRADFDFGFVVQQRGMFSYSGLTKDQVAKLRTEHSIYAIDSGRICIAALNSKNVRGVAAAIAKVLV